MENTEKTAVHISEETIETVAAWAAYDREEAHKKTAPLRPDERAVLCAVIMIHRDGPVSEESVDPEYRPAFRSLVERGFLQPTYRISDDARAALHPLTQSGTERRWR